MLTIKLTPNLAGLAISGDFADLQQLYDALNDVVGQESEEGSPYEMPALYILALCYELRQAWQGDRLIEFADNGLTGEVRQTLKILAPQRNVYFKTRIFLPEILFDIMTLNDFLEISSRKQKIPDLQPTIQLVRWFQAETTVALQDALDENAAQRLAALIFGQVPRYRSFYTQYVDVLTEKYLEQPPEKRRQQILPLARRLNELGADYQRVVTDLTETAAELNCSVADLEPVSDCPVLEEAEW